MATNTSTSVFEPSEIEAMSRALKEACEALHVSDTRGRQTLATRILDLAQTGVIAPEVLRDRVVREANLPLY